jgi:tRNA (guanosine-2'-O-)-methyltransferase
MTPERLAKITEMVARRQGNLTVILENVHDPHNIGAVLRSCDSVGIFEVYILYTEPRLMEQALGAEHRTSMGARKWIDIHYFTDMDACFDLVRSKYETILSSSIEPPATELLQCDLTRSTALLFGNEKDGISQEANAKADGHFFIPQVGMVSSLNISVACAVTLYEAYRQRIQKGMYQDNPTLSVVQQQALVDEYVHRHNVRKTQNIIIH